MGIYSKIYERAYDKFHDIVSAQYVAKRIYKKRMGRSLNLHSPVDLNEKINWLKFYGDTSMWTDLADKYKVREFVKNRGLERMLIPLYAKWDTVEEMSPEGLPNSFVLKTNHGSGEIMIVKDARKLDWGGAKLLFKKYLSTPFGKYQGEPHYMSIKPCIIVEKLLDVGEDSYTSSLVDYKMWCFDGAPYYIWACYSRTKDHTYVGVYDLDWNYHPEKSVFTDHYRDGHNAVPRPKCLDEMIEAAKILSKGFTEVRVDLYEHEDKVYFGEMTFTSNGGYMDFYTQEFLNELGGYCKLPPRK